MEMYFLLPVIVFISIHRKSQAGKYFSSSYNILGNVYHGLAVICKMIGHSFHLYLTNFKSGKIHVGTTKNENEASIPIFGT